MCIMSEISPEKCLERLNELIYDEDKIVTDIWFSKELNVPLKVSREIFEKFVKKDKILGITYVVSGILKNTDDIGVYLLKDNELDKIPNIFENKHKKYIHSIQKNINVDYNIISLVDKCTKQNLTDKIIPGSIISKNCTKRDIKIKKIHIPQTTNNKGKTLLPTKQQNNGGDAETSNVPPQNAKKQNNIAAMFSKAQPTMKKEKDNLKVGKKVNSLNAFLTKGSGSIDSNKSGGQSIENSVKSSENSLKSSENSMKSNENLVESRETNLMEVDDVNIKNDVETLKNNKSGNKNNKKNKRNRSKSDENNKNTKRRKRIIESVDSDSEKDIFASDESQNEEIIENIEITEDIDTKTVLPPKNKKRKTIEKTYEDDEGYIVTKTEYVYESGSEEEKPNVDVTSHKTQKSEVKMEKKNSSNSENEKTEKSPKKVTKKGATKKEPPKNQPTLMNFFKKK